MITVIGAGKVGTNVLDKSKPALEEFCISVKDPHEFIKSLEN